MRRAVTIAVTLGLLTTAAFGQRAPVPQPQPPAASMLANTPGTASDAPIGPRDQIEVKVFQDPNLNTRMTVTDDGRITMPLIGKVDVSGLTPVEVEQKIKALLEAKYINKA